MSTLPDFVSSAHNTESDCITRERSEYDVYKQLANMVPNLASSLVNFSDDYLRHVAELVSRVLDFFVKIIRDVSRSRKVLPVRGLTTLRV